MTNGTSGVVNRVAVAECDDLDRDDALNRGYVDNNLIEACVDRVSEMRVASIVAVCGEIDMVLCRDLLARLMRGDMNETAQTTHR